MSEYVRCICEWRSFRHVEQENFGRLGSVYTVVPNPTPGYPQYLTLAELHVGYVNKDRFEPVTVTPCA